MKATVVCPGPWSLVQSLPATRDRGAEAIPRALMESDLSQKGGAADCRWVRVMCFFNLKLTMVDGARIREGGCRSLRDGCWGRGRR